MINILLVDDDAGVQNTYGKLLKDEGYQVHRAKDVETATSLMIFNPVDIVLLDINMPKLGGDIMKEIIQIYNRRIKVIVASVLPLDVQRKKIPDADEYFDKSHGTEVLLKLIKEVLLKKEQKSA